MKFPTLVLTVGSLTATTAFAQMSPEQRAESNRRMDFNMAQNFLVHDFQVQTMQSCGNVVGKTTVKQLPWDFQKPAVEETGEVVVSVTSWTGGCAEGKRDGSGVIEWTVDRRLPSSQSSARNKAEGRFVKGTQLGLWCILDLEVTVAGTARKISSTGCYMVTGEPLRAPPALYRKQPDGRWQLWAHNGPASPAVYLPAGSMETQSEKMIAAAMAGTAPAVATPALAMESQALNELVRGSKIDFVPTAGSVALKDKRIAVVLSSSTEDELERFKREREALIAATRNVSGEAAQHRARFIQMSNPERLMTNIFKMLRTVARDAQEANDLSVLDKGGVDYVLVIDWKSLTRFDLLGKYDAFPATSHQDRMAGKTVVLAGQSIGGFLIAPGLKAVKQFPGEQSVMGKAPKELGLNWKGDSGYLTELANFYQREWGKGPDDPGTGLFTLEFALRR
jgi:hypothetical protein